MKARVMSEAIIPAGICRFLLNPSYPTTESQTSTHKDMLLPRKDLGLWSWLDDREIERTSTGLGTIVVSKLGPQHEIITTSHDEYFESKST